ncbi:hypothetical protein GT037_009739 [Alternaria burnsii]|uniref:DUF7143 domain-containing protein n=3 Tax=Alternaria sect. Alternaria TaxID=2499237 RepID=A0A4Q4N0N6_ALTAL|nr:uncharacterized protein GT037_009739 [Alternaria burnsii]XP_051588377.1 uncharacterized protein J4E82_005625 [Alternaria postmessia]RII23144.1 hypothetical protein CUC08_Gglean011966 [Alternaria sp. MG1]RYN21173.1 hypothetical protein AA0115_g9827 [Alternaria tenuissima]RYN66211.1 hypothetical protein AA0117_g11886 [Alternaria alternata]KAF7672229.1 hypothetical protein GT037_009739 [Alternaria burnsii]KAI5375674.1 hypothetical protein J4E82_005625 [Alternaria postmessia]
MYTNAITILTLLSGLAIAAPTANITPRQGNACFIIGNEVLPGETADVVNQIQAAVTCDPNAKTLENVPDVTSGSQTFSKIDFSTSGQTPLQFATSTFTTAVPLADSNLEAFQDALNVYLATEAGLRSSGGNFGLIKAPKFFLEMQISRINTARGQPPTDAAQQVDHLKDKVTENAVREDQAILDQVAQLATQLS